MQAPSPRDSLVVGSSLRCHTCGQLISSLLHHGNNAAAAPRRPSERFIKPAIPAPQPASPMDTSIAKD